MAVIFADSFDPYANTSDMTSANGGPWGATMNATLGASTTTQFGTGQTCSMSSTQAATFTSGTNESTVYGSFRIKPTSTGSSTNCALFYLNDAGTTQCAIRCNSDGSVQLYSGTISGTLLQTYSSIYTPSNWNSFQFKIVIHPSAGSIEIRVNGSPVNSITKTGANTRGGTSNSYCNGFTIGNSGVSFAFDDVFLNNTSGNDPTSWCGDVRGYQMLPVTATTSNFTAVNASNTTVIVQNGGLSNASRGAGVTVYHPFTPTVTAKISQITFVTGSSATANVKCAIYDGSTGSPGTVLGTSNTLVNPVSGTNTVTFGTPVLVYQGVVHYLGYDQDASVTYQGSPNGTAYTGSTTYSSFPAASPTGLTLSVTTANMSYIYSSGAIAQMLEDGDTSYISSTSVQEDTYTLSQMPNTYNVLACQYYVMWRKSDAGTRSAQLSVSANGSADTAEITASTLTTTYYYQFLTLEKDPTGAYWTPTTANAQVLGLAVTV